MSISNDSGTLMTMPVQPAYMNGGFGGGYGMEWMFMWLWPLFLFGGYGGGLGGGFGGGRGTGGAVDGYVLTSDFANIERKIDGVYQGQCQNGYNAAQLANTILMEIAREGRSSDHAICQLGYQTQLGFQTAAAQAADCCCKTQTSIGDVKTQSIFNTKDIQQQLAACCCENEKIAMQSRFDAFQNTCETLRAIEKVGDRIIDYLAADKAQALRDENQALRLAASQVAQNQYLVSQLRPPFPIPAYTVANPFAAPAAAA